MTRKEQIENAKNAYMAKIGALPIADEPRNNLDVVDAFIRGAEWADAHPDISMVSALAYEAGHNDAIEESCKWLKRNIHLCVDYDDDGIGHIDSNFVDYFKMRLGMEIRGNQRKISPNRIIGTGAHIKVALDVLDKKGDKK